MKKIILTILAVFYLGMASGASVHFHYCVGKMVSWGFEKQSGKICDSCGMPKTMSKKTSCCKDVEEKVKVEKSQKASQISYKFDQFSTVCILPELTQNYQATILVKINREALSNAPPDGRKIPVYLKNCTYRI